MLDFPLRSCSREFSLSRKGKTYRLVELLDEEELCKIDSR